MSQKGKTVIVGKSQPIVSLLHFILRASGSVLPVLVEGDSGTGKELVASSIHEKSPRSDRPFIAINCGAMPPDLVENELFGHEAGAFTGATNLKRGLFEIADTGTLFIDEIGEMDMPAQSKLLRVLDSGRFRRLGGVREISVDVRIIAATNRMLEKRIEKEKFRSDLYYRLSVIRTFIPCLKDRKEDIPLLVNHLLATKINTGLADDEKKTVQDEAMRILENYDWPGNVRELFNVINRAALLAADSVIKPADLPAEISARARNAAAGSGEADMPLDVFVEKKEAEYIGLLSAKYSGDKAMLQKVLCISRAKLYRKLAAYKII